MSEVTPESKIYNRLVAAPVFHPASADLFTDWNIQAGDVLTVQSDGESYQVPVYGMKLRWFGSDTSSVGGEKTRVQVESTGNPEREPLPAMKRREYSANSSNYKTQKSLGGGVKSNQESINLVVEKTGINDLGVTETLTGRISVEAGKISQIVSAVGDDGSVTAASIIAAINGDESSITLSATKIDLQGYVTMDSFTALQGSIQRITAGETQISKLWASDIKVNDIDIGSSNTGSITYQGRKTYTTTVLSADGTELHSVIALYPWPHGPSGLSALSGAFNGVSASASNGTVTFTFSLLGGGTPVTASFNMAATSWYAGRVTAIKSAVSSALGNAGWSSAGGKTTVISASLDTTNKQLVIHSAIANISYPGEQSPTQVSIGLPNLDLSGSWPSGPTYTAVQYARGGLTTMFSGNRRQVWYEEDGEFISMGPYYWYRASDAGTLETLYKPS